MIGDNNLCSSLADEFVFECEDAEFFSGNSDERGYGNTALLLLLRRGTPEVLETAAVESHSSSSTAAAADCCSAAAAAAVR